jgi:hypothetical protein
MKFAAAAAVAEATAAEAKAEAEAASRAVNQAKRRSSTETERLAREHALAAEAAAAAEEEAKVATTLVLQAKKAMVGEHVVGLNLLETPIQRQRRKWRLQKARQLANETPEQRRLRLDRQRARDQMRRRRHRSGERSERVLSQFDGHEYDGVQAAHSTVGNRRSSSLSSGEEESDEEIE